jgi:hypothetical protein
MIYSGEVKDHEGHVKQVLSALEKNGMKVKLEKSEFGKTEVQFLGHIISKDGIKIDPNKIKDVLEWPELKNVGDIRQFTGLTNYCRRYIRNYSDKVEPLTRLLKKEQNFVWGPEQRESFANIKEEFTRDPALASFELTRLSRVETDALDKALGGCLTQPDDQGKQRPVAYHSRKFNSAELNYDIHDKELLAVVETLRHWRTYLRWSTHQVEVWTDHKNLTYWLTSQRLTTRQIRWV